jgi:hypothetical protein
MPLRDHFRPPTSKLGSWGAVHGGWPMVIVQTLAKKLPPRFVAHPKVHLGTFAEIDVSAYEKASDHAVAMDFTNGDGGVATAVWAPAQPTLTVATDLASQDAYEVLVYDIETDQRLVAAIELVSPANKDRPENRRTFVVKCAALLQNQVAVTIVDVVTTLANNLYGDLLELIGVTDPALGDDPRGIYAVSCRAIERDAKRGTVWPLDTWYYPLQVGVALPTLPLWLTDDFSIPLELEASYEETCAVLRIA